MPTKPTGRPRGRPKGALNKPKTVEQFVVDSMTSRPPDPPRKPKMAARGPWANKTPEERKAYSQKLIAARKGKQVNAQTPGKPARLTNAQWAEVQAQAEADAKRIIKKMKDAGQLPDDELAVEALTKVAQTLREATTPRDIASLGRLMLDFTKTKPVQKHDHTVRTMEDELDEMGRDDD